MPTVTRHQDRRSGNIFSGIVSQSSATNAWYVGRYFGNNNKNNGNNYAPFSAYAINAKSMTMKEYVKIEDVNDAYMDCRRTKRRTATQIDYELDYELNNLKLYRELNNMTYEIGQSIAFCVTYPKLREVYAASFRDRIVHHLIMRKFLDIFEDRMIESSYNCRKEKGTIFGVRDIQERLKRITRNGKRNAWVLKLDIRGFFMSIDKNMMYDIVSDIISEEYEGDDIDWWLWLIKKIILHHPECNCVWKSGEELRSRLPADKSLSTSGGRGVPIGNYTSQIFANLYMTVFDKWLVNRLSQEEEYGRYVDDFVIISPSKARLLSLLTDCKIFLSERLGLMLHDDKIVLTKASQGVKFTGYVIRQDRIYVGKHTVKRMEDMINEWNNDNNPDVSRYIMRYNSYMGFLLVGYSYNIRKRMWESIKHKENLININNRKIRRQNNEKIHQ